MFTILLKYIVSLFRTLWLLLLKKRRNHNLRRLVSCYHSPSFVAKRSLVYKAPVIHLRSTLSGGSDPLLIVGSFRQQSETRQLILRMTIYNATHVDIAGLAYDVIGYIHV